jgi:arylsulfatase A-like enzyme
MHRLGAIYLLLILVQTFGEKQNILLIIIDDLRPDLKAFGHFDAPPTPHIDAFANSGRTFLRTYAQVFTTF